MLPLALALIKTKKSPSFWPIGLEFFLAIKNSCKMSFFWPMGQNYFWYQSSAVKNHLLKNKHNFLSKRRILVKKLIQDKPWYRYWQMIFPRVNGDISTVFTDTVCAVLQQFSFLLNRRSWPKKEKSHNYYILICFPIPYSLMIQRHLSYNIYILHHVSMYYIWRKIHWNDNQLLEMFYLNTIEQLFPFIEH